MKTYSYTLPTHYSKLLTGSLLFALLHVPAQAATDCSAVETTGIPQTECEALVELWNSTNGPNWTDAATNNWNVTDQPCSWDGVGCEFINDEDGKIIGEKLESIDLSTKALSGALPEINLPDLVVLHLGQNQLSGTIPDFSHLPNLRVLILDDNPLSGTIPNFSHLPKLIVLSLDGNTLSGTIPDFSHLPDLELLSLESNQLSGTIPDFSHLPALDELYLGFNQLSGTIPDFSLLPSLDIFTLEHNQLSGAIPNFNHLPALKELYLESNQLSGAIPNFSHLPRLARLNLGNNQLSGAIPNFNHLSNLISLYLNNNQLFGDTPSSTAESWLQNLNPDASSFDNNRCIAPTSPEAIDLLNDLSSFWEYTQSCNQTRLVNISTRCTIAASPNNAVSGFVISGSGTKRVLIRAIRSAAEPNADFNLRMTLYQLNVGATATQLASNDEWQEGASKAGIENLSPNLIPGSPHDAALIIKLAPGVYTAEVSPVNGSGVGTISVDDLDSKSDLTSTLRNISGRCNVGSANLENAVAGFVIQGAFDELSPLLRGIKSMAESGNFDPKMTLYGLVDGQFEEFDANDDWQNHSTVGEIEALPANYVPDNNLDSAMIQYLEAGVFTLNVSANGNSGVSMVGVDLISD